MLRIRPEEYFLETANDNNDKTIIYLGLIIFGIIACISIVAITKKDR